MTERLESALADLVLTTTEADSTEIPDDDEGE